MESPHIVPNPELQYDSLLLYQRHLSNGATPYIKNRQDIANNIVSKYSTEEFNQATNQWNTKRVLQFTYTNNMISTLIYTGGSTINYRYVQNSNNLPDSLIETYSNGMVLVYTYTYNNSLLSELNFFSASARYKTVYNYNTAGSVTNSTTLTYNYTKSQWDTANVFNYNYNTGNQLIREEFLELNIQNQALKLQYTIDIQYDNNGNRVEDVIHFDYYKHGLNNGLVKVARKQYGYNAFGLVNDYEVTHWNDSAQSWELGADSLFGGSQKVHLEYDVHWPQDVPTIDYANRSLKIFPSPASGYITVRAENMSKGVLKATIYDMCGHALRQWEDNTESTYVRTIPVKELPAGCYVLRLQGGQVSQTEKFIISQ